MFAKFSIFLLSCALICGPVRAQTDVQPAPIGWYVIGVPSTSVAQPAVEGAKAEIEKLKIRLVVTSEIKSFLRELDKRNGLPEKAGQLISKGREFHLGMKLAQAIDHYRKASEVLGNGYVQYYDPGMLAEPILQLGVALFQGNKKDEARKAFMRAASLVPSLQMSEGYYSPSVRQAFARARTELGALEPTIPRPGEIGRICEAAGLKGMVVLSVERLGDRPMLRMALFDTRIKSFRKVETAVLDEKNAEAVGQEVAKRIRQDVATAAGVSFAIEVPKPDGGIGLPDGGVAQVDEDLDPWYVRHWWIWPVAAAVIGTAVALPLTVFRRDVVDVNVY
jgi:hypothetical protein